MVTQNKKYITKHAIILSPHDDGEEHDDDGDEDQIKSICGLLHPIDSSPTYRSVLL